MFILQDEKIIFIHIPKCGGTSISLALDGTCRWNDLFIGGTDHGELLLNGWSRRFGLRKHSTAKEIKLSLGEEVYGTYLKVVCTRNPFDRFISACNFLLFLIQNKVDWAQSEIAQFNLKNFYELDDFIDSSFIQENVMNSLNWKTIKFDGSVEDRAPDLLKCFIPQMKFLDSEEIAVGRLITLHLEDIMNSENKLLKNTFLRDVVIEKRNVTPNKFFSRSDLSPTSLRNLRNLYKEDFEGLRYSGGLFE